MTERTSKQQDILAVFNQHVQAELNGDLDTTMATMTDDPHLYNMPNHMGGEGREAVREFYKNHHEGCPGWMTLDKVPGVFMLDTPPTFVAGAMPFSQSDATGGLIPYKNPYALVGYYLTIFSMIPFMGIPLGVAGIICGIVGVRRRNRNPIMRGTAHAWFAILFSALVILIQVAAIVSLVLYRS